MTKYAFPRDLLDAIKTRHAHIGDQYLRLLALEFGDLIEDFRRLDAPGPRGRLAAALRARPRPKPWPFQTSSTTHGQRAH